MHMRLLFPMIYHWCTIARPKMSINLFLLTSIDDALALPNQLFERSFHYSPQGRASSEAKKKVSPRFFLLFFPLQPLLKLHLLTYRICKTMSQADSISMVGTVGTWLAVFLTLVGIILSYRWRCNSQENSSSQESNVLRILVELRVLRRVEESKLEALERIEKLAIQVKNEAGAPMLVHRVAHSSSQDNGVIHPN